MRKYRGFVGEVPTLGNLGQKEGYEYVYPELVADPSYRGAIQQRRIPGYVAPVAVAAPVVAPLVVAPLPVVEPPPPIYVPPTVILPPPIPGNGPIDLMEPDIATDDYNVVAPVSIGPTAGRGAGPAGSLGPEGATGNGAAEAPGNNALAILMALAALVMLGG
jgi:hypothetical protein